MQPDAVDLAGGELDALGCGRVIVLCGSSTAKSSLLPRIMKALGNRAILVFDQVIQHSSTEIVTEVAEVARSLAIDGIVAIGGGSVSDTAKGVAILLAEGGKIEDHAASFIPPDKFYPNPLHKPKLPILAVPTTASGAEATPGLGIRNPQGEKKLFWDVKLAPRVILIDPKANLNVPAQIMAETAMNGFAHCVEGLYSRASNPVSEALALHAASKFHVSIPAMVEEPTELKHRADVLAAAHLAGLVIANARVGIHHAICHSLGAAGGISHGQANSIMLPHAMRYNLPVVAPTYVKLAQAIGVDTRNGNDVTIGKDVIAAVEALQRACGVPTRLRDVGVSLEVLPRVAEITLGDRGLYFNPRRTDSAKPILELLNEAW
jgi:alcohol dehydrogenase class IV